jgi:cell wall-associated NlpC family hydrolase
LLSLGAALLTASLFVSVPTPAHSEPSPSASASPTTVQDASAQVRQLEQEASAIEADYDEASTKLKKAEKKLKLLQADVQTQKDKVDQLAEAGKSIALTQFKNGSVDATTQLLTSSDPQSFLGQLSTATKVDENMNSALQELLTEQGNLADLERILEAETQSLQAEKDRIAELKKAYDAKLADAQATLARLTAEEQAKLAKEDGSNTTFTPEEIADAPEKIQTIVNYAVAKVKAGSGYVWGASGPNNFDCSGFTLAAYRQVGISLPHSSQSQANIGKRVSKSELKAGDLIIWYGDASHVGLYIGNGKIAHARNPRVGTVIQTLASYPAPFITGVRIIGS